MRAKKMWKIYTKNIADATGKTPRRVRADIRDGIVDPQNVLQLSAYVMGGVVSGLLGKACKRPKQAQRLATKSPLPRKETMEQLVARLGMKKGSDI